jgi:beta-glucanase (GH16 family)
MREILYPALFLGITCTVSGQVPGSDPHWHLIFEEQFDSIDPALWKVANDFDHYGEPQVYTHREENVSVSGGELLLRVNRESYRCSELHGWACNKRWYDYTSGWIETREALYVRYGYLESRIRLPHGYGLWPAFWTFVGDSVPGRHNAGEIDIFEMLGDQPPTVMGTNMHLAYCKCGENDCQCDFLDDPMCPEVDPAILCHGLNVEIPDYSDGYLVYAVEWNPSKIIWYVNNRMVRNSANPGIIDPVRIIFNLAVAPWRLPDRTTPFPSAMHVDYLRIYRLEADNERFDSCSVNLEQYDYQVKRDISIGGEGCANSVPAGADITLRAAEGIGIKGEFTVPPGAQLYLDVNEIYE